jgi:hypothetical protein
MVWIDAPVKGFKDDRQAAEQYCRSVLVGHFSQVVLALRAIFEEPLF